MATIRQIELKQLEKVTRHTEVSATVALVEADGEKYIQIDTYGSADREIPGKISQSLRISKEAWHELVAIAARHF
jgi:hypothetical protein